MSYLIFVGGLALLLLGGDWLVKGAVGIAQRLSIPPLVIGLTIVAFGTSAPELIISLRAALGGNGGIALGNVVGSNIANVFMVLGIPAIFATISCRDEGTGANIVFLGVATMVFLALLQFPPLGFSDGLILVAILAAFLAFQVHRSREQRRVVDGTATPVDDMLEDVGEVPSRLLHTLAYLFAGLITLPIAAELTVNAAVTIAEVWDVPDDVIGLTIVAIGTSLPELATAIMAARAGTTSVLVGSIIGSNLFNIAAILGITTLVVRVPVSEHIVSFDVWIMVGATAVLAAVALFRVTIGTWLGLILTVAYFAYLTATVLL